jgi:hypothetical protein
VHEPGTERGCRGGDKPGLTAASTTDEQKQARFFKNLKASFLKLRKY